MSEATGFPGTGWYHTIELYKSQSLLHCFVYKELMSTFTAVIFAVLKRSNTCVISLN